MARPQPQVLISARTPGRLVLERFGYILSKPGVYYSDNYLLAQIPLISLNELSNSPHNAFIRCFASKKREKHVAFNILRKQGLESFQKQVQWLIAGLWESWFIIGGSEMDKELTPEKVIEMGKMWGKMYLSSLSPEERLAGLEPKDRLAGLSKKELQRIYKKLREDIEN